MRTSDNWGWRARIGLFIVSSEAVPEAEWWAMAPPGVSVHAARVAAPTPWAAWRDGRTGVELSADLQRGADQFAAMRLDAVVLAHSSSSFVGGPDWDAAAIAALSGVLGPDRAVTTNGADMIAALRSSRVTRPLLVIPPWFDDRTLGLATDYLAAAGIEIAGHLRHDPGPNWRDVPPREMYPRGLGFEQDVEALYRQVRGGCPDTADGVLIAGTGFRCVAVLEPLERDLGRPVISANQASLWRCLTVSGLRPRISGYGALLAGSG